MITMDALRFTPGSGLDLVEAPTPSPAAGEVIVEVVAAGLCGSDVAVINGARTLAAPIILGHEISGTVVAGGAGVDDVHVGDSVVVSPIVVCGECPACARGEENLCESRQVIGMDRDGGLARFVAVPAANALPLPASVPHEWGAICVDAVATPFHALKTRARLVEGEAVAVLGIGGLGQHAVQLAAAITDAPIVAVDVRAEQLDFARLIGATAAVDARVDGLAGRLVEAAGGPLDVVLDFAGVGSSLDAALASLRAGGRAVRVALEHGSLELTDPIGMVRSETMLAGSYGFTRAEVVEVLDMVASGRLDLSRSISHTVALADVPRVLDDMAQGAPGYRRVVVNPVLDMP